MAQKETHKWADFGLKKIYFVPWHLNNPCRQPVINGLVTVTLNVGAALR
jgi:hypothetical protein